jgi:uncharacterized membrane protein (UPF0127 family)
MAALFRVLFAGLLLASCGKSAETQMAVPPEIKTEVVAATDAAVAKPSATVTSLPKVTFETQAGPQVVTVEVVSAPLEVQRGLMYRRHLEPDAGMLFLFPREKVQSFWMKNTLIPLDMIFIKSDMTVAGFVENAQPLTTSPQTIGVPSQYVLEVNGGWARRHGVSAGTKVKFDNLP